MTEDDVAVDVYCQDCGAHCVDPDERDNQLCAPHLAHAEWEGITL